MIVLVDMDGVVANFEEGHRRLCDERGLPEAYKGAGRTTWDICDTVAKERAAEILELWHSPGFFRNLAPIAGAFDALHAMLREGHEVFLCTAPMLNHPTCAREKLAWVVEHLGREFSHRVVITRDKTIVHGDYLLDDKPEITGVRTPTWTHVIFDQFYNRVGFEHRARADWSNYRAALRLEEAA